MVACALNATEFVSAVARRVTEKLAVLTLRDVALAFALEHDLLVEQVALVQQLFCVTAGFELNKPQLFVGLRWERHDFEHGNVKRQMFDGFFDV